MAERALYRKMNDRSQNSSTYHKKDGTNVRAKLKASVSGELFMLEKGLPDGDYILTEGAAWFTVGVFSVRIMTTDEGVVVNIYPLGREEDESIASTYAFSSEAKEEV